MGKARCQGKVKHHYEIPQRKRSTCLLQCVTTLLQDLRRASQYTLPNFHTDSYSGAKVTKHVDRDLGESHSGSTRAELMQQKIMTEAKRAMNHKTRADLNHA